MAKYPYRDLGVGFDRTFRNDLNSNFDDVESDIVKVQEDIDTHVASATAHAAEKITYTGSVTGNNVKAALDEVDNRIDNIIAGAGNSNAEIVDARYDSINNVTHATLKDRLDSDSNKIGVLSDSVYIENYPRLNNETDDTGRFIRAIADVIEGGTLRLASKQYDVKDVLVSKAVNIEGRGKSSTIINAIAGSSFAIKYDRLTGSINNIKICDLQIKGVSGLQFYHVHRWEIQNVEIKEVQGDGFVADYSWVGSVISCYMHHNTGKGVKLLNDSNAVEFFGTEIQGNEYGVWIGNNCLNPTFTGCTIEGNRYAGVYAEFVKVLNIEKCYFEKNGFQPGASPPHALAHVYIKGGVTSKAYGVNIKGSIFNEIRNDADGTSDGYSIYLDNVIRPVLEGNAYLYNGLGSIYCTANTDGVLSINDYTDNDNTLVVGTTNRVVVLKANTSKEFGINGNIRGLSTNPLTFSSQASTGGSWALLFQSKNSSGVDTPRLIITAGLDTIDVSTNNNNFNVGTGLIKVNGVTYSSGNGSPEGVVTAVVGSVYTRKDGGAGTTLYIKESGTGNTGWVAK